MSKAQGWVVSTKSKKQLRCTGAIEVAAEKFIVVKGGPVKKTVGHIDGEGIQIIDVTSAEGGRAEDCHDIRAVQVRTLDNLVGIALSTLLISSQ